MSKQRMAGSKEFRDKIEERKGTEWYDSASEVGDLHDAHMSRDGETERYSGAEIRAEMRAGRGDMTTEELTKKYEDMYASGEINLNGNAKDFLRDKHGANLVRNGDGGGGGGNDDVVEDPIDPIAPPPTVKPTNPNPPALTPIIGGPGNDQIVNQDNDINSTVKGDGNTVTIGQDNSVTQNQGAFAAKGLMGKYVLNLRKNKSTI